jgi:curli production assembly/transport component CsgG
MKNKQISLRVVFVLVIAISLNSCSSFLNQPIVNKTRARLGPETQVYHELKELPKPEDPIVVAVYKFRDQTGQYKPAELGSSWSTAITQGATTILIRALEESGWFIPIERENIGNLLNERKIIRSSRLQYSGKNNANKNLLPPLLFAGVILEGGIISYESNVRTGGMGVRYFGTGGSTQYREDRISIYLRAVSTSNGKILKTVYTTKTILSQKVDIGVFKYVDTDKILEAEAGYTRNEPSEMAVTEAIQMAVESLVFEGIEDHLWNITPEDSIKNNKVYNDYSERKRKNLNTNEYGGYEDPRIRGLLGVGLQAGANFYEGDYNGSEAQTIFSLNLDFALSNHFSIGIDLGSSKLSATNNFESNMLNLDAKVKYIFLPFEKFSPSINIGGGIIDGDIKNSELATNEFIIPMFIAGLGLEYMITKKIGISLDANYNYYFEDNVDGLERGTYNDLSWNVLFGIKYYIGKR